MRESFPQQERRPFREPVGIRLMGKQDPTQLTRAEFLASEDVVYHAARVSFAFDPFLDYTRPNPYDKMQGDGGMTLGGGFYTTSDYREALNYSLKRGGDRNQAGRVYALLPYHARVLDLRAKDDLTTNGDVPKELVDEWTTIIQERCSQIESALRSKAHSSTDNEYDWDGWHEYRDRLEYIQRMGKTYDLRTILGTGDSPIAYEELPEMPTGTGPAWIMMWSQFMLRKGIDGIVYHEGSEVERGQLTENIVFYNLTKIGTWESWHREQGHGAF